MTIDLHHAHLFATDIDTTLAWWTRHMGATVLFDGLMAGARNVFIAVGSGRLHIYAQAPRDAGRGAIHHLGLRVQSLREVWAQLQAEGIASPHGLREHDGWRYVMIAAPDGVLLELFEFDDPAAPVNLDGRVRQEKERESGDSQAPNKNQLTLADALGPAAALGLFQRRL